MAAVVECISEGVIYQAADGQIKVWNKAAEDIFGLSRDQATGLTSTHHDWKLINEDVSPCPGEEHPSMITLRSGQPLRDQVRGVQRDDGSVTWLSISTRPIFEPGQDQPTGVVISFRDISQQRRDQEALRQSEERYRQLVKHAPAGIYEIDLTTGRFLSVNDEMCRYTGYSRQEFLALSPADLMGQEDLCRYKDRLDKMNGGRLVSPSVEYQVRLKDGGTMHVLLNDSAQRMASGHLVVTVVAHDITQRRQAELRLRQAEERLRTVLEMAPMAIYETDAQGDCLFVNAKWRQFSGLSQAEAIGQGWRRGLHPDDQAEITAMWYQHAQYQEPWSCEYRFRTPEGKVTWVQGSAVALRDDQGQVTGYIGTNVDITERKAAEGALREITRRNDALLQGISLSGLMLFVVDGSYKVRYMNQPMVRAFGNCVGQLCYQAVGGMAGPCHYCKLGKVIQEGQAVHYEVTLAAGRVFDISAMPYVETDGTVCKLEIIQDITERKANEQALRASEEKFRLAFQMSPLAIAITRLADGKVLLINEAHKKLFGNAPEEIEGRTTAEIDVWVYPEDRRRLVEQINAQGHCRDFSTVIRDKQGHNLTINLNCTVIDYAGERCILSVLQDLTQSIKAQRERQITADILELIAKAQDSEDLLRAALARLQAWSGCEAVGIRLRQGLDYPYLETSGFPPSFVRAESRLCAQDDEGRVLLGPEGEPLLDCMCGNIIQGRFDPSLPFFTPGGSFWSNCTSELLATTSEADRQARTRNRCNGKGYESVALIPLRAGAETFGLVQFNDKRPGRFSAEMIALSERLAEMLASYLAKNKAQKDRDAMEARLRQAHKMQAVGTLAGGIAHEFNNLLAVIMGYGEMVRDAVQNQPAALEDVATILLACQRGKELVRQLAAFSRQEEPEARPLAINREITSTRGMLEKLLPRTVSIATELDPGLSRVGMAPGHFQQVFVNLVTNAAQAMPKGGHLNIRTGNVSPEPTACTACGETFSGPHVLLEICDSGPGMDAQTVQRIFEPFFTTRGVGAGKGMGLPVAGGILKIYGGHVVCRSAPGEGTCMQVYLPAYEAGSGPAAEEAADPATAATGLTVLLVDDEEALRGLGGRILKGVGYRVLTAGSGEQALEVFAADPAAISLVILDLGMPGMGGQECLRQLLAAHPQARVVVASGYTGDGQEQQALAAGAKAFVSKPFRKADLLAVIRGVLAGGAAG